MRDRRRFLLTSLASARRGLLAGEAQQPRKLYRIGTLEPTSAATNAADLNAVRQALRDGRDLTQLPLRERRPRLEDLVAGSERVFPVRRLAANGLEAWEQVLAAGYQSLRRQKDAVVAQCERAGVD